MLVLQEVSKAHGARAKTVLALDRASFHIPEGDFVSIVGPSGSGKSTLLLIMGGMLSPDSGEVLLDGKTVYELPQDQRAKLRREKVGFVFQTFNLVPYLSALENVQVPLFLAGVDESRQKSVAASLLDRMGLSDRVDHKPNELSVGQQQRVALARMLANDPKIILADEPTGSLDPETGESVLAFLEEINREGRTVVVVTHDPEAAKRAQRSLKIVSGRVSEDHPTARMSP